jgi:hypothetical protein
LLILADVHLISWLFLFFAEYTRTPLRRLLIFARVSKTSNSWIQFSRMLYSPKDMSKDSHHHDR